ncbi:aldehyde dehydrogenase, dimeric NADP-preferring-like [Uloborus diversus]|uniref:aldehyde dehydrogenase, dimeric NADP-preferring-like n=1 Tax=Uloborus diversus TaxID=327109 RepID=UPI0024092C99|nr:aldehyde dehydrogenase, dimeric NADP-preferring-like [Uloborus diversus]
MNNLSEVVNTARKAFNREVTKPLDFRVKQLKAFHQLLEENGSELVSALQKDLKKPYPEALLAEVESTKNQIKGALFDVHKWVQPETTETNIILLFDKTYIFPQPYGVVLIIGAWNYPFLLVAVPLLGAIAAGNCVIIKPSEKAPATAKALSSLIPQYLDKDCFHVVTGGVPETTALLNERFDYIFYTGSPAVGKKIREASNKYLTPCTLELGGKCPVYIDDEVDIELAAKRIIWGKMLNLGQTCVAPDYILCSKKTEERFIELAKKVLLEFFGAEPENSPDLSRIVNEEHFERIIKFLNCGKIAVGGDYDPKEKYIAPTILTDIKESDSVMQEEIFGPVLPILRATTPDEAIKFINKREKPLTLYLFSSNKNVLDQFLMSTSSGSMCVNDTVVHLSVDSLPFGGVGMSGMGTYHGKYSFDTFSHKRSVLVRSLNAIGEYLGKARYPPYSNAKTRLLKKFLVKRPNLIPPYLSELLIFVFGMLTALTVKEIFAIVPNETLPRPL